MSEMVPMYGFGGSGGGTGAALTVNVPALCTVTVTKDDKTKTKVADSSGVVVFKGLATGTWTVIITDGEQTAQKTVTITADYSTVIAFFAATIQVTYPAGSTCTASDGVTTFVAPDTSGTWSCVVPNAGTWTVTVTDGASVKDGTVDITQDGQSESLTLAYWNGELYDTGNQFPDITGGWTVNNGLYASTSLSSDCIIGDFVEVHEYHSIVRTKNKIVFPFGKYTTLKILTDVTRQLQSDFPNIFGLYTSNTVNNGTSEHFAMYAPCSDIGEGKTYSLDVSGADGIFYVAWLNAGKAKVYKIWLE